MMRFLVLLCVLGTSFAANTVVLNHSVDEILSTVKTVIRATNTDNLVVPGFSNDFHYKVKFIKGKGHLSCDGGWVNSLASIQRTGDATITKQPNKSVLRVRLGLGTLNFGFNTCHAKVFHISTKAKMDAHVSSNSIDFQISLTGVGDKCIASLDHVVMDQLGSIKIKTGGGLLHKIENKILDWATRHFHSKIVGMINEKLQKLVVDAIPKLDLCKRIPH